MGGLKELQVHVAAGMDLDPVREVVKMNGAELQQKVMRNAPVDTGALKRYIMLSIMDGGLTARVNPLMNYSSYPEYGTRFMAAQPYIRPAMNAQKQQFKSDLKRLMG